MMVIPRRASRAADLTGQKFGRLTAVRMVGHKLVGRQIRRLWICVCECGNERSVDAGSLRGGNSTSCGCARGDSNTKHGGRGTPEYAIWKTMIQRCTNPKDKNYVHYGARGITVCDRWRASFTDFLADMGKRPDPKLTLERMNNEEGYAPGNCEWASRTVQALNTRPKNTNRSGVVGVHWDNRDGAWRAQICINRKKIALGRFTRIEDAKIAYDTALAARKANI